MGCLQLNSEDEPQRQLYDRCITGGTRPTCGALIEHLVGRRSGHYCSRALASP
jgi:hypothetical protein